MGRQKGISIVSDGDSQKRPLINLMAVTDGKAMFLEVVDYSGEVKDEYFNANLLKDVINEVGPRNVIQVITNAPNCKSARQLIKSLFPTIVWTPWAVHTLHLASKKICATKNVKKQ